MSNKYKWTKFAIATFLVAMFFFNFVRQWTEIPKYHIIYITPDQESLNSSRGLSDYLDWGTTFAFFTTLSNIIAITLMFIEWASFGRFKISKKIKVSALLYMVVTGLVFWTSIAPFMPWGFDPFFDYDNVHEHAIVLIAITIFVLLDKRGAHIRKKDYLIMLIYPILYLVFSTILNIATPEHVAAYAFLNYYNFFGLGLPLVASVFSTLSFIILLILIFIGSYWALAKLTNKNIIIKRSKKWTK